MIKVGKLTVRKQNSSIKFSISGISMDSNRVTVHSAVLNRDEVLEVMKFLVEATA